MTRHRVAGFAILVAMASVASAAPEAIVRGWARGETGSNIEVFDAEGMPQERQDLSGVNIKGRHPWDPSLQLVRLSNARWVESRNLDLVFCDDRPQPRQSVFRAPSTTGPTSAKTYGSGNPCDRSK